MSDSTSSTNTTEVTYTVVELLKSKRRRRQKKHHQQQLRTLRVHALHVSSSLVPSELLPSPSTTATPAAAATTPSSTPTLEEDDEEQELGQKRTRSDSLPPPPPPPLPATSWLLAQELAEHALALVPSYVRKRLTCEPLASLPQWSSREPEVLRVVARLNRQDPLRSRNAPKVAKLLPLSTARALLEQVGGDHKPAAQHLLYYLRGEQYEEEEEEQEESSEEEDEDDEVSY